MAGLFKIDEWGTQSAPKSSIESSRQTPAAMPGVARTMLHPVDGRGNHRGEVKNGRAPIVPRMKA